VSLSERYLDEKIGAFLCDRVVQSVSKDIHRKGRTMNNSVLTKKVKIYFSFETTTSVNRSISRGEK